MRQLLCSELEILTLLHSEWAKLCGVLAVLSAIGLINNFVIFCLILHNKIGCDLS